ncbi:methyltransferase domain-containing protein [Kovacikia minuta CCNUW1]|uniref:SAM-dependent methyltransferase n=1 Tax=Kovacikia minuta TaxID=2931930 RepID=UPI001CCEF04A|nr:class I SAM-dependent methyltransferase [Kovacikia minuta]UBF28794.1 methyltransferase domain-containing protein [Kovacikia minuta CCNUW1]
MPINQKIEAATSQYLDQVCNYYDTMNPLYLKHVGQTFQGGWVVNDSARASNLYLASQAGIQPGCRVLDAGCGVCGPSIDIAQEIESVQIDAITLSPIQAQTARELVQQAGLAEQIQIQIGDYHDLPFAEETFDIVFFFESSGHSYDHQRLFREVDRVLRPGGTLYIKDVFCKELPLSDQEQQELAEFNQIYVYRTPCMSETIKAISDTGFQVLESRDFSGIISTKNTAKAMFEYQHGFPFLSEFGKFHYRYFKKLPVFFGDIKALKPAG